MQVPPSPRNWKPPRIWVGGWRLGRAQLDDLRRLTRPQRASDVADEAPKPPLEGVESPLSGDLDEQSAGENRGQRGHDTGGQSTRDPRRCGDEQNRGQAGGVR